ncbi:MAG: hypothetical protein WC876_03085 [Candidatus Thermoplasmatota archaeon]
MPQPRKLDHGMYGTIRLPQSVIRRILKQTGAGTPYANATQWTRAIVVQKLDDIENRK